MPPSACSNLPTWRAGGAGEGAFFVAEEFGFDEFGGNGGAIEGDEGVFVARRFFVDGAGDEFLAGAGFAEDADAGFAGGDAIDLREEFRHGGAGADEFVLAEAVAEFAVFVLEAGEFESIFDGEEKLIGGERLFEEIESAEAGGFDGHFDVGLAGDQNDGSLQAGFFQFFEEFEAAFAGHDHVGEDEVEALVLDEFDGAESVVADGGFVAGEAKGAGERGEGVGVVVDEEKMGFAWHVDPFGPIRTSSPKRNAPARKAAATEQEKPKSTGRNACATKPKRNPRTGLKTGHYKTL